MKKLLIVLSILAVLTVLASAGIFGFTKYKEMESKQQNLEAKLENKEFSNKEDTSNNQEQVNSDTQTGNKTESEEDEKEVISLDDEVEDEELVTRDNVFDYLFAGLDEMYDGEFDKDLITFQDPVKNEDGDWKILANNKSGHGSYVFVVTPTGLVEEVNNAGEVESTVQVNSD